MPAELAWRRPYLNTGRFQLPLYAAEGGAGKDPASLPIPPALLAAMAKRGTLDEAGLGVMQVHICASSCARECMVYGIKHTRFSYLGLRSAAVCVRQDASKGKLKQPKGKGTTMPSPKLCNGTSSYR